MTKTKHNTKTSVPSNNLVSLASNRMIMLLRFGERGGNPHELVGDMWQRGKLTAQKREEWREGDCKQEEGGKQSCTEAWSYWLSHSGILLAESAIVGGFIEQKLPNVTNQFFFSPKKPVYQHITRKKAWEKEWLVIGEFTVNVFVAETEVSSDTHPICSHTLFLVRKPGECV